jgi:hypothetical protein
MGVSSRYIGGNANFVLVLGGDYAATFNPTARMIASKPSLLRWYRRSSSQRLKVDPKVKTIFRSQ